MTAPRVVAGGDKPLVAIVGRPNVGKSTLFNRLVGERLAIVEERPGTTRDRLYADTEWAGRTFQVIDTGGLVARPEDTITAEVRKQAEVAIAEADVILLLTDVEDGVVAADKSIASELRRSGKPILLAVNKADNEPRRQEAVAFYELGLGEPMPISALHGRGIGDLLDRIVALLPLSPPQEEVQAIRMAIIGRPNVGKSSLLNAILGWERAIVHEVPGTTRDALDTYLEWDGQPLMLIDTAGIRRAGRIQPGLESYAVLRALRAIGRSDVALLVLDGVEGPTAQDAHIAGQVLEEGKGLVLAVNKWDLVQKDSRTMEEYTLHLREHFKFIPYVPILFISALTRQGVDRLVETALKVYREGRARISDGELEELVQEALTRHAPPTGRGRRLQIHRVSQVGIAPPTFAFSVNDAELAHFSYQRYLENQIRERFPFAGTPIRLFFRAQQRGQKG